MQTSARVLETAFEARVAALHQSQRIVAGAGAALIAGVWGLAAWFWQALRRKHRAELERMRERAKILETELARGNAERALRMTEQQFRAVFDGSDVGIAIVDCGDRIDANAALRSMFEGDLELVTAKCAEMFREVIGERRDSLRAEHCFEKSNGEQLWAELSLLAVRGGTEDVVSAVVLVHDVTEHKMLNARLDHETLHDALTGLPNRVKFIRRLSSLMGKAEGFAVVFVDLDGFKAVNDTLGHHAGDGVLRMAAYRLSSAVRPVDLVARLHGDEFAVIIRDISFDHDSEEIEDIVGRLRDALAFSIDTPTAPLRISASIGYVRDAASYRDAEQLLRDADSAMYHSKLAGRDRATAYEPAMAPKIASLRPRFVSASLDESSQAERFAHGGHEAAADGRFAPAPVVEPQHVRAAEERLDFDDVLGIDQIAAMHAQEAQRLEPRRAFGERAPVAQFPVGERCQHDVAVRMHHENLVDAHEHPAVIVLEREPDGAGRGRFHR